MPTFGPNGRDEFICQKCARVLESTDLYPQWRPDITGNESAGNVCMQCIRQHDAHDKAIQDAGSQKVLDATPMSLTDYCRQESGGLEGAALTRYINRYYGHG